MSTIASFNEDKNFLVYEYFNHTGFMRIHTEKGHEKKKNADLPLYIIKIAF